MNSLVSIDSSFIVNCKLSFHYLQHTANFNSKLQVVISVLVQLAKLSYTIKAKL